MEKVCLFCDIDNTVIYSHRHPASEPVRWVESLEGRRQAYITEKAHAYFRSREWLRVIPVTSRLLPQYLRLRPFLAEMGWDTALICNGAVLMRGEEEDGEWRRESVLCAKPDLPAFGRCLERAASLVPEEAIVSVPELMFYIKAGEEADRIYRSLLECADPRHTAVLRDASKVYCVPVSLGKGYALRRYRRRFGAGRLCLAAGDSPFDLSMLDEADVSFCPEELSYTEYMAVEERELTRGRNRFFCGGRFSDSLCDALEQWHAGPNAHIC